VGFPGELIPIVLFICVAATIIGAPIARAIARRIERGGGSGNQLPSDIGGRLERMEQAIDAIAVEVERIAEGQRFTSKLLAGRSDAAHSDAASPPRAHQRINQ
jgi:hypothetical protein